MRGGGMMLQRHRPAPDLLSVSADATGGDACFSATDFWLVTAHWTTAYANDVLYKVTVDLSTEQTPSSWSNVASDETTSAGSFQVDTGIAGNVGGATSPTTHYRTFRVRVVRRADSQVMEEQVTNQVTLTVYTDPCA